MNFLLIEQYSKLIQELIQHTDDILRAVVSDDELRQEIRNKWYPDDDIGWNEIVKAEADSYTFNPSIYPDNFFNE